MDDLETLVNLDFGQIFLGLCVILLCTKLIGSAAEWLFVERLGITTKKMREQQKIREQLEAVTELAKTTAENLDKLQKRHIKDEEEFRNNLNNYIIESRTDRKELHDEMAKFSNNRVSDQQQNLAIQKELNDSIKCLVINQESSDEKIENLTTMFINKEIDDMRYKILDFASSISSGKKFNKESYDHILKTYQNYEQILKENNMKNGLVEESVKYIQNSYQETLKNGGINYL